MRGSCKSIRWSHPKETDAAMSEEAGLPPGRSGRRVEVESGVYPAVSSSPTALSKIWPLPFRSLWRPSATSSDDGRQPTACWAFSSLRIACGEDMMTQAIVSSPSRTYVFGKSEEIGRPSVSWPQMMTDAAAKPSNDARLGCVLFFNIACSMALWAFHRGLRSDVAVGAWDHPSRAHSTPWQAARRKIRKRRTHTLPLAKDCGPVIW